MDILNSAQLNFPFRPSKLTALHSPKGQFEFSSRWETSSNIFMTLSTPCSSYEELVTLNDKERLSLAAELVEKLRKRQQELTGKELVSMTENRSPVVEFRPTVFAS
jgi:hypothetical protein